jgi:hypothetical protein
VLYPSALWRGWGNKCIEKSPVSGAGSDVLAEQHGYWTIFIAGVGAKPLVLSLPKVLWKNLVMWYFLSFKKF